MDRYGQTLCEQWKVVRLIFLISLCVELPGVTALVAFNATLVKVKTDVTLQCQGNMASDGVSNTILWFKGTAQLANSDKYTIVAGNGNSSLTVHQSGEADIGVYMCTQYGYQAFPQMLSMPVVTKLPTSVSVITGDALDIKCTGWGWPTPYVLWTREDYFNHIFGIADPQVNLLNITTDYGLSLIRAQLQIDNLNRTDQMQYMCIMVNDLGKANSTTYVRVKDRFAAVWPFIGIVLEVILIIVLIIVGTIVRSKNKVTESKTQ